MKWETQIWTDFRKGKLELMYRQVYPGLVLYARRYFGSQGDLLIEDCVQNAIFHAWQRRGSFENIFMLKSFLYTSIKNEMISIRRKETAREHYVSQLEQETAFRNSVIDHEARVMLYQAIQELPEKVRVVFEMSFIEGLKNAEIAGKLNLSDSSVKKYKARALAILRTKLNPILYSFLFAGFAGS